MKQVVIIGGGLSGTLCALNLVQTATDNISITIIEKDTTRLHKGVAYANPPDTHILNVAASGMSIYPDEPEHFTQWLQINYPASGYTAYSFASRKLYGEYVAESYNKAISRMGHQPVVVLAEVSTIATQSGMYIITTSCGKTLEATHIILCTGNNPTRSIEKQFPTISTHHGYIPNLWKPGVLQNIGTEETLLIVGTRLTMADQLLSLQQHGHKGKTYINSRRGLLPLPHADAPAYKLKFKDVHDVSCINNCLQWIKEEIAEAEKEGGSWHSVVNALRDLTPGIWQGLTEESKKRFLRHLRPFWDIHRHRLPAASLAVIDGLIAKGAVVKIPGRIKQVAASADNFIVTISRGNTQHELVVNRILDCSGTASLPEYDPLLQQLCQNNMAQTDPTGTGIVLNNTATNIYLAGPVAKANYWECMAVREIRMHARDIAMQIVNEIV